MLKKLFSHITAVVLAIILMANHISTVGIMVNFVVNQDYIAKTLCIQKDNQKGCNGKCQLAKQLNKENPASPSELPTQEAKRLILDCYFVSSISVIDNGSKIDTYTSIFSFYTSKPYFEPTLAVDYPPPVFS